VFKHFSTIKHIAGSPAPTVDFNGVWRNELRSEMNLVVDTQGNVIGKYKTGVGSPEPTEEFDLVGFASGDLLSFTVNFGKYGSLTSWAGQHTMDNGSEVIKTLWLLARNIKDPDESANLWGSVLIGYNNFQR
jgi:Avidin family